MDGIEREGKNNIKEQKTKRGKKESQSVGSAYRRKMSILKVLVILVVCAFIAVLVYFSVDSFEEVFSRNRVEKTVVITEISSGDTDVCIDMDGEYSDWIEIYNPSEKSVNLSEYYISDNIEKKQKFRLPVIDLESGEYFLVFASGKNKTVDGEVHANFKISSAGEEVFLVKQSTEIQKIIVPQMPPCFSYGIDENGKWSYLRPITPLEKNKEGFETLDDFFTGEPNYNGIYINEYMASNQTVFYDEDGDFGDWFEIINLREEEVNIEGYSVSDDLYAPTKWSFPNVVLKPGEAVVVFADSKDRAGGDMLHAGFSLAPDKETLYFYDKDGVLRDAVPIFSTDKTVSFGRDIDDIFNLVYFPVPTPGQPNTISGYAQKKTAINELGDYLYISEVMPTQGEVVDADGEKSDWIEIYNASKAEVDISGFYLSDSTTDYKKWAFPNGSKISAGEHLVVLASKRDIVDEKGFIHTNFKLEALSESVCLMSKSGYIIDTISPKYIRAGHSLGRKGTKEVRIFEEPTPRANNNTASYLSYTPNVVFSEKPGVYSERIDLSLGCPDSEAKIYYTLDGSVPNEQSKMYTEPIAISKSECIRAIAITDQKLPDRVITHNYLIGRKHDLPIVFISTDRYNLYGERGIITKASRTTQVPANIEIVELGNDQSISFDAGIRIFGNTSRYAQQKSFAVELDESFGDAELRYPLFLDDNKTPDTFKSFVLRNGGSEEWNRTKLTDASLMNLSRLGMNVDAQCYRPAAIYINGKYYGLTNIREKLNRDYIEMRYGHDTDIINIIEPRPGKSYTALHGSSRDFMALVKYIKGNDLSNEEKYRNVEKFLDIDNYIDTILAHIILGNKDSGNLKFWKPDVPGAKWRVFLFDLDRAAYYSYVNHFETRTSLDGHGSGKSYDTGVLRGLLENEEFRYKFSKRALELTDTIYSKEFATAYYDYLAENIETEMDKSLDLWWEYSYNRADPGSSYGSPPSSKGEAARFVEHELNRHRKFFDTRQRYIYKYHKSFFGLSDKDIAKMREEIAAENSPAKQIYDEFISTGSINNAITLANTLETVIIY